MTRLSDDTPGRTGRRTVRAMIVGVALLVTLSVGVVVVHARSGSDCAHTSPPDTVGVPIDQVRSDLVHRYGTPQRKVAVNEISTGGDTRELLIRDAHGRHASDTVLVQVVRAPSGRGWLITTNTCGR